MSIEMIENIRYLISIDLDKSKIKEGLAFLSGENFDKLSSEFIESLLALDNLSESGRSLLDQEKEYLRALLK